MIQVKVSGLSVSNVGVIVLLKGPEDQRTLPIFIGPAEAQAIAVQLDSVQIPRPLTHDLLKNILDCVEWRVKSVAVCDLVDGTFYARLLIEHDGVETEVDSRPSDAIAIALRCGAPISVAETVMDQAGVILPEKSDAPAQERAEAPPAAAAAKAPNPTSEESLKARLQKAITDERYEDAARLRDQLQSMKKKHAAN